MAKVQSKLASVLEQVKKDKKLKVDQDTIVTGKEKIDYISTGSIIVDKLLGKKSEVGGVGRGRIIEIFGLEASGKTTLALSLCKEIQNRGGNVCFCDFEAALDMDYAEEATGIDTSNERFAWLRPQNLEEGCNIVDALLEAYDETKIDIVVMDSVKAMIPKLVLDGLMGDEPPMALQARRIGQWINKVTKRIKDTGTILVFLNQMSKNIKSSPFQSGGEYETPGGLSIRFYASQRIHLKLVTKIMKEGLNPITNQMENLPYCNKTRATIVKNKIGTPYRNAEFYILYGKGIDNRESAFEMAINHGVITRAGAWLSYKPDEGGFKFQGEDKTKEYLYADENRGLFEEIVNQLLFKQDEKVREEAKRQEEADLEAMAKRKKVSKKEKEAEA